MSRRKFTSEFKFKVVLEGLSERYSTQELGRKYDIHPTQTTNWKSQFIKNGQSVYDCLVKNANTETENLLGLQAQGDEGHGELRAIPSRTVPR